MEATPVVEVELVFEWNVLFFDEYDFADDHAVDEALRESASGIGGVILWLNGRRPLWVVEVDALFQWQDEVHEV